MGAGCYLCELNYGTIPGQSAGDAVGACKLCGVLACLAHAIRNSSKPAYTCGICVPNLLAAAAVRNLGTGGTPPQIVPGGGQSPDTPSSYARWALDIVDVEDVIGPLADERWAWMRSDVEYLKKLLVDPHAPPSLRAFAHADADRARTLMAAAAAFATQLRLPPHELLPVLQQVAQDVKRHA